MKRRSLCKAILLSAVTAVMQAKNDGSTGVPRRRSPPLEIATVEGTPVKVHAQKGKVVLIDFMTTVCPTCKVASSGIQKVYQELGGQGFSPVAVALNTAVPFMLFGYKQQFGLTFPLGVASREVVMQYLQHPETEPLMVPTLVLLDKKGRIVSTVVGWRGEEELRQSVLKLLRE
jgi:peroxiredoxin